MRMMMRREKQGERRLSIVLLRLDAHASNDAAMIAAHQNCA